MKEISTEELKAIQLEIAKKIHAFCQERGLRYYLAYGSLIGALRHKGYIPWDDDIDLAMPRPDYEVFIHSFNGAFPDLELFSAELQPRYYAPYANVCKKGTLLREVNRNHHGVDIGVKVDVFPIDGAPSDEKLYKKIRRKIDFWTFVLFYRNVTLVPRWKKDKVLWFKTLVWKTLFLPLPIPFVQRRIRSLAACSDFESSALSEKLVTPSPGDTRMPREVFEEYVDVEFEGFKFKAPKQYDRYQRAVYGDYMQLPPEEQRVPFHGFRAYWL